MTTINHLTRLAALPILSAGIIAGAALSMAGTANAATPTQPTGPGYSYSPATKAHPAPTATPGWRAHHGAHHIADLQHQMGR
jgi:hypothetical protein